MLMIKLKHEGHHWVSLRDRMLNTSDLETCTDKINKGGATWSPDEVFMRFLLDRLEKDLIKDRNLYVPLDLFSLKPGEVHVQVERPRSRSTSERPVRCRRIIRQSSRKHANSLEEGSSDASKLGHQSKATRTTTPRIKGEGKINEGCYKCGDDKSNKTAVETPKLGDTESSEGVNRATAGAPERIGQKGRSPRTTRYERTSLPTDKQKDDFPTKEDIVTTRKKQRQQRGDLDDAEKEAMMYNKHLKEIQPHVLPLMYSCRSCDEQFPESENLRMHTITAHLPINIPEQDSITTVEENGEPKSFTHIEIDLSLYQQVSDAAISELAVELRLCPECNKYVDDVKSHIETHMVKNYICEDCGKGFASDKQLTIHRRYHQVQRSGVMSYTCDFCDKTFRSAQSLSIHRPLHNKARNYVCEHCGKAFKDNMRLQKHIGIHAKNKRYSCAYCARKFAQKCNLNRHVRIHTGEKPYDCCHCDQTFNHNVSLKKHMKKEHLIELEDKSHKIVKEIENFPTGRMRTKKIKLGDIIVKR